MKNASQSGRSYSARPGRLALLKQSAMLLIAMLTGTALAGNYTVYNTSGDFKGVSLPSTFSGTLSTAPSMTDGIWETITFTPTAGGNCTVTVTPTLLFGEVHDIRTQIFKGTLDKLAEFHGSGTARVSLIAGQYYTIQLQIIAPSYFTTTKYSYTVTVSASGGSSGPGVTPVSPVVTPGMAFRAEKARQHRCVVYDDLGYETGIPGTPIGIIDLKVGQAAKITGKVKVTGKYQTFDDVRRNVDLIIYANEKGAYSTTATGSNKGYTQTYVFTFTDSGVSGTIDSGCSFTSDVSIGGDYLSASKFAMLEDDFLIPNVDGVFYGLLPDQVPVDMNGRNWTTPKAFPVKAVKGSYSEVEYSGDNPANLKLTYNPKTGMVKGSFYIYSMTYGKLKKHKASFLGAMIDDLVTGFIKVKDAGNWIGVARVCGR